MASNFCGKCGSPLDPATGRCPHCEAPVQYQPQPGQNYSRPQAEQTYYQPRQEQAYYQQSQEQAYYQSGQEQAYYQQPYSRQTSDYAAPPKKDGKNVLIILLAVLVVLLIAGGVVTLLGVKGVLDIPFLRPAEDVPAAVVTTEATTAAPVTEAPTTVPPTTVPPTTAAPATSAPSGAAGPVGQQYKLENPMRLRAGPGTGYGYSRVIPTGAYVGVVSSQGDWAYVYYNGEYGWLHGPTAFRSWWNGGTQEPAATVYPYKATLKNAMKLRTGPSIAYGAKTVVPKGAVVTVYEQTLNDAGEAWARISYNGVEGWVRSKEAGL